MARGKYPNQFVKVKILKSYIEDNKNIVEDVAVIKEFNNNREATRELVRAKEDELVYILQIKKLYWKYNI